MRAGGKVALGTAAILAVLVPSSLLAADRSVHYSLRLTVNDEPFLQVDVGKTVFVHASLSPTPSKRHGLFKDVVIRQRAAGSSVSQTVRTCPASRASGCLTFPSSRVPAKFYYQAFLFDTTGNPKLLAKSAVVTVTCESK